MVQKPKEVILTAAALSDPFGQSLTTNDCFQAIAYSESNTEDLIQCRTPSSRAGELFVRADLVRSHASRHQK